MNNYIKKEERKKILLVCDDIRVNSGVAHVAREIVVHTSQHYNWINMGAAINHPELGKKIDISKSINDELKINDSEVFVIPTNGYVDINLLRMVIKNEKPDALMLITDPRYFEHIFSIENEIRKNIPIIYLNIWDSTPAPLWNTEYYESCDSLLCISKQTKVLVETCLEDTRNIANKIIEWLPHGLNHTIYRPYTKEELESKEFIEFKKSILGNKFETAKFNLLYNSRNIRRKQLLDTLLAWKVFIEDYVPDNFKDSCNLILHTNIVDEHGTDLYASCEALNILQYVTFDEKQYSSNQMAMLYNICDGLIQITSNEGWGLSLTEAMLCGKMFIANTTGGMQDQMGFKDNGKWFEPTKNRPSLHTPLTHASDNITFNHGSWCLPVVPTNISLQGSPKTPYIFDDRCSYIEVAQTISKLFTKSKESRTKCGLEGREYCLERGFTSQQQSESFIKYTDKLFSTWKKREQYNVYCDSDFNKRVLKYKIV